MLWFLWILYMLLRLCILQCVGTILWFVPFAFECCLLVFWFSFVGFWAILVSRGMPSQYFHYVCFFAWFHFPSPLLSRFHSIISSFIQPTWHSLLDAQVSNKLHRLKPSVGLGLRSNCHHGVVLTHLCIGHCRLIHHYLLCDEEPPVCAVHHLLLSPF